MTPSTGQDGPPVAERRPKVHTLHGDRREDSYDWMREKSDPAVAELLEAENAYADGVLAPAEPFRKELYREMLARIQETDESVPYREGNAYYYHRTEEGKQYPIHCRRPGSTEAAEATEAAEEIILDLNAPAEGHSF